MQSFDQTIYGLRDKFTCRIMKLQATIDRYGDCRKSEHLRRRIALYRDLVLAIEAHAPSLDDEFAR